MNHPRYWHGCAFVPSTEENEDQVVVVAGYRSDSTVEYLSTNSKEWMLKESVPLSLWGNAVTKANSPDYLVFSVGGYSSGGINRIYGLSNTNKWEVVANLKSSRYYHSSLKVPRKHVPNCA